uniref:Secreted protein n=1 Tax=Parascaris univalens TaxID=6257 RepID=A0A915B7D1_PARUN
MSILQWQVALSYHTHKHTYIHTVPNEDLCIVRLIPTVSLKVNCRLVNCAKEVFEEAKMSLNYS